MSYLHTLLYDTFAMLLSCWVPSEVTWGDTSEQLLLKAYPIVLSNRVVRVEIEVDVNCENAQD